MPIYEYNKLSNKQTKDIKNLISICNAYEELNRNPSLQNDNLYKEMNNYYLYYEERELISVLLIDQLAYSEAEITGYTLPRLRRQGFFCELLDKALDELAYFDIFKINLIVEPKSISGALAAKTLGEYAYSEYMLVHNLSEMDQAYGNKNVSYKEIHEITDLNNQFVNSPQLIECFETAKVAIQTEDVLCYEAYIDNELVGICNVSLEMERAYLFGLYVLEKYRRQRIGYSFVQYILNMVIKAGKEGLMLQVGDNPQALNLYLKIGFHILDQLDYYIFYIEEEEEDSL